MVHGPKLAAAAENGCCCWMPIARKANRGKSDKDGDRDEPDRHLQKQQPQPDDAADSTDAKVPEASSTSAPEAEGDRSPTTAAAAAEKPRQQNSEDGGRTVTIKLPEDGNKARAKGQVAEKDEEESGDNESDDSKPLTEGAWLVLIMFCATEILTAGIASSFSMMYMEPLQEFQVKAAFKSWVFNIGRGLASLAGFIAGPFSGAFGHNIAVFGLLMGPIGLVISSFAWTPYLYLLSHTFLVSMGFGFSHYILYLHMHKTFNKRRGLASGIHAATRAGSAILMPQLALLLSSYVGYRDMMRIMASLGVVATVFAGVQTYKDKFKPDKNFGMSLKETFKQSLRGGGDDIPHRCSMRKVSTKQLKAAQALDGGSYRRKELKQEGQQQQSSSFHASVVQDEKHQQAVAAINNNEDEAATAAPHQATAGQQRRQHQPRRSLAPPPTTASNERRRSSAVPAQNDFWFDARRKMRRTGRRLTKSMDFSVFREPVFIVFTTVDCILSLTATNVFLAIPFYAVEREFSPLVAATFLSVISATEAVGGFIVPPLFDLKRVNYLYIFSASQFFAAWLFIAIGCHVPQSAMFVICAFLGFSRSATTGMSNVFLIRYLSICRFPSALSAKVLFKFGIFCVGPVTGYLVDVTGSYSTCFFAFAGMMVLSGTLSLMLPCIARWSHSGDSDDEDSNNNV